MTTLLQKLEAIIKSECQTLQQLLAKIETAIKPIAEEDLKVVLQAGIAAGLAAATSGQSLTLDAVEAAAVIGGRAMLASAEANGITLAKQTALAAAAAVNIPVAVPNGANGQ